jgi:hypothetical protein
MFGFTFVRMSRLGDEFMSFETFRTDAVNNSQTAAAADLAAACWAKDEPGCRVINHKELPKAAPSVTDLYLRSVQAASSPLPDALRSDKESKPVSKSLESVLTETNGMMAQGVQRLGSSVYDTGAQALRTTTEALGGTLEAGFGVTQTAISPVLAGIRSYRNSEPFAKSLGDVVREGNDMMKEGVSHLGHSVAPAAIALIGGLEVGTGGVEAAISPVLAAIRSSVRGQSFAKSWTEIISEANGMVRDGAQHFFYPRFDSKESK